MESNKEMNFISAVVYCCDDSNTIGSFIEQLNKTLCDNFLKYEIIVVNDASVDDSVDKVKSVSAQNKGGIITIMNMSHHQGLESSMNAGVDLSIGDFVFEFDTAVGDFDWSLLMELFHHSLKGYDIVSARPNRRKNVSSQLFYTIFNHYANLQYDLSTESFRVLSRRAINRVRSITESTPYRKASYANCGLAIDSLVYTPTIKTKRKKYSGRKMMAIDSLILYTDVAYHVTVGLAAFMALITVAFGIFALFTKLYSHPVEGWTTIILFIAFGFSGLFIILAMALKYLQIIVSLVFRKKNYLFESIEKLQ
ncbi:MAG: glycosyltransferase [Bacteroidales bacterium]|nr:glycosyltransferase [Bacteroidales bacterium]